jgi:hypothetical protein
LIAFSLGPGAPQLPPLRRNRHSTQIQGLFLPDTYRNDSTGADIHMRKPSPNNSAVEVEERFLLQALHRLRTEEQRYVFTLMADLLSQGMLAQTMAEDRK